MICMSAGTQALASFVQFTTRLLLAETVLLAPPAPPAVLLLGTALPPPVHTVRPPASTHPQPTHTQMLQRYAYDNKIDRFTRFNTEVLTVRHQPDGRCGCLGWRRHWCACREGAAGMAACAAGRRGWVA